MSDEEQVQGEMEPEKVPTSMQDLLETAEYGLKEVKRGDVLAGTILDINDAGVLVSVDGIKSEGIISGEELSKIPRDVMEDLKVGDAVQTYVVAPSDRNGNVVLALTRTQSSRDWAEAEDLNSKQEVFEGTVAGYNKGGLIVKVGKIRGFIPASQLVTRGEDNSDPAKRLASLVGRKLHLKVIEMDREQNRLILSERAAERQWRKQQKEKMLTELKEGDVLDGTVISLADFGAFIDLGGADGLVHLSEISWQPINKPSDALKIGQKVKVQVLRVDPEHKRVGLSIKRCEPDPWSSIVDRYKVGMLVEAQITKMAKFGAFARVKDDDAIEGLIHISELSDKRVNHPKEVVQEGQWVTLRVIRVEPDKRRLGLSLKRVTHGEYMDEDWRAALAEVNTEEVAPPEASVPPTEEAAPPEASVPPVEETAPAEEAAGSEASVPPVEEAAPSEASIPPVEETAPSEASILPVEETAPAEKPPVENPPTDEAAS
jgi:small subunit ribosomal protein S1